MGAALTEMDAAATAPRTANRLIFVIMILINESVGVETDQLFRCVGVRDKVECVWLVYQTLRKGKERTWSSQLRGIGQGGEVRVGESGRPVLIAAAIHLELIRLPGWIVGASELLGTTPVCRSSGAERDFSRGRASGATPESPDTVPVPPSEKSAYNRQVLLPVRAVALRTHDSHTQLQLCRWNCLRIFYIPSGLGGPAWWRRFACGHSEPL